ncbi:hypothetical protein T02_11582 [Trichinella nativa]|uniref:Uncharacterized protein n=1 Tax=Trichinella nativa TaxID=6335 RepID=A0A0V1L6M5_9BILA|nr:hypothetical protein T02_11582 [Trichinella nativa]
MTIQPQKRSSARFLPTLENRASHPFDQFGPLFCGHRFNDEEDKFKHTVNNKKEISFIKKTKIFIAIVQKVVGYVFANINVRLVDCPLPPRAVISPPCGQ